MLDVFLNLMIASLFLSPATSAKIDNQLPITTTINKNWPVSPQRINNDSLGMEITAQSFIVVDKDSGRVLYEKKSNEIRPIASITKLMTALVFLDHNPGWQKEFTVSSSDYRLGATTYLIAGEKISIKDLFNTMLVVSSNEGAAGLARSTGLTTEQFVAKMNEKAKSLGMKNSIFADCTGLNSDNKSTAADLAILIKAAFAKQEIVSAVNQKSYTVDVINKKISRRINNTDKILGQSFGYEGKNFKVEAGKTGYIDAAGYCFASQVSDQHDNEIISVVLGSSSTYSRFNDTKSLAYWVFKNYKWE